MSWLDRERTVAPAGFNRYVVPIAALLVHLSIGQVYAFSTFTLPMTKLIGITQPAPGDWSRVAVGWIFSIAILVLGCSAAVLGRWVERVGPRRAMFTAALCFGGGFLVAALGVSLHQLWLVFLGYGVLGGCGLGIGYISPVSTLIKWFPDRPGMATGMAIMGFGGGALIAAPVSITLMHFFATPTSTGVAPTLVLMGLVYLAYMMAGAAIVRVPAADWRPARYVRPSAPKALVTDANVAVDIAWRTPQFWLLWIVLCLNVTAGIALLSQASPMIQEMFPGQIDEGSAAAFVSLLSLFNMAGRFFWSSISDKIGRRGTYTIFFLLGAALYLTIPNAGRAGSIGLFMLSALIVLSMYGGGFATIPAYLRDIFGTMHVGAIHGRLLTAWAAAGVIGPLLINDLRAQQIASGVSKAQAYSATMYVMAGLLLVGFACNALIRPVAEKYHYRSAGANSY